MKTITHHLQYTVINTESCQACMMIARKLEYMDDVVSTEVMFKCWRNKNTINALSCTKALL